MICRYFRIGDDEMPCLPRTRIKNPRRSGVIRTIDREVSTILSFLICARINTQRYDESMYLQIYIVVLTVVATFQCSPMN